MCDHQSPPWCHKLENGQEIQVFVCVNCQPGETPERCQKRYDDEVAQAMSDFPPNCNDDKNFVEQAHTD